MNVKQAGSFDPSAPVVDANEVNKPGGQQQCSKCKDCKNGSCDGKSCPNCPTGGCCGGAGCTCGACQANAAQAVNGVGGAPQVNVNAGGGGQ